MERDRVAREWGMDAPDRASQGRVSIKGRLWLVAVVRIKAGLVRVA